MTVRINRKVFEQTSFDSARPSGAAVVVHQLQEEGDYEVAVDDAGRLRDARTVSVAHDTLADIAAHSHAAREEAGRLPAATAAVVLGTLSDADVEPSSATSDTPAVVARGGYLSLTLASVAGEERVRVRRVGAEDDEFDSARLDRGDKFAATLLRPGTYSMLNELDGARGSITVTYPVVGDTPYRPEAPAAVTCGGDGFEPNELTLGPAQGLIVDVEEPARILIDLVEPDDGPADRSPSLKASWRTPRPDAE